MKAPNIEEIFVCDCHNVEHSIVVRYVNIWTSEEANCEPDQLWLSPHLTTGNFWWRLRRAWCYLINKDEGTFDEILLTRDDAVRFRSALDRFIKWENYKIVEGAIQKKKLNGE